MAHQLTVTAKTGPDRPLVATVLQNVTRIDFTLGRVVQVHQDNMMGTNVKEFDIAPATAVTFTITAGQYAMVLTA